MKNLEQLRAAHALPRANKLDRRATRKLPALIINNGLLAAAAFTLDSDSRGEMRAVIVAIEEHLRDRGYIMASPSGPSDNDRVRSFISELTNKKSIELQRATSEALAYLGYLKRFAPKGADAED